MEDIVIFQNTGIEKKEYQKVLARLPEYHRGSSIIGNSTSQSSYSLQTMNMISDSPLSRMKQCLAQIDKRYHALRESHFKVERMKLQIKELEKRNDASARLKIDENLTLIEEIQKKMAQSFRRMGMFQDMYDDIMKNNNIPENWTEKDFEIQEVANMIRSSFRIAIQDVSANGRVSRAAVEFWEQLGIHPQLATKRVQDYLINTEKILNEVGEITIQLMYDFLDEMATEFKDVYKLSLKRAGLDELGSEAFMVDGATKPR